MDPIANMLTKLRNAQKVNKPALVPYSTLKHRILEVLKEAGFVADMTIASEPHKAITVTATDKSLDRIVRLSKPGRRLYAKARQLQVMPGRLVVLSTPAGILTAQAARKKHVGGELLFEVRP